MASAIRASPAPVASSRRDARGGSLARGRSRAARIPRAARPAARADDGELLAQDDGDGPVGGGADARVGRAPSVSSATLAAVCASASLIFGAAHAIDADPALAVGTTTTSTDPQPSLAERDRRTASRMVDAFDALSREDKVRVVERLMFETESAMTERDDGGPGGAGDGDVRAPTPRGWGEAGSGRYPGAESKNDEDKKPDDDDDDENENENEARYAAAAARRRALLEPLASSSSSFSVDALREMDERDGWSTSNDDVPGSKPRRGETFFGGGQGASNKEPLDPLFGLFGGDDDDGVSETDPSSPSGMDGVFQKLFQWFREEGPVLTDLLNDPNARYRAGSLVLVGSLVLGTLTESRGASDVDGNVEGSNPVPAESSDSGDAVTRPETDDDDDAEDERGEEKTKKKTKNEEVVFAGASRRRRRAVVATTTTTTTPGSAVGRTRPPPPPSGGGVLWTRAEAAGGVDGAARREGRRRRRGGARGGRRTPLESSEGDEEGDRGGGDRFDRFEGDIGEERERRGTFARAPGGGSAPTSPPPVIGPVEDENMEGFRLSGRGRTQR